MTKIDGYKSNADFRRAIELTLPQADNLYTFSTFVRAFEDAANNGFKPDMLQRSIQMAKSAAEQIVAPGSDAYRELITGPVVGEDGKDKGSIIDRAERKQVRLPKLVRPGDAKAGKFPPRDRVDQGPITWNFGSDAAAAPAEQQNAAPVQTEHSEEQPAVDHQQATAEPVAQPAAIDEAKFEQLLLDNGMPAETLEQAQEYAREQNSPLADSLVALQIWTPELAADWVDYAQHVLSDAAPDAETVEPGAETHDHDVAAETNQPVVDPAATTAESHDETGDQVVANAAPQAPLTAEVEGGGGDGQSHEQVVEKALSAPVEGLTTDAPAVVPANEPNADLSAVRQELAHEGSQQPPVASTGDGENGEVHHEQIEAAAELPTFDPIQQAILDAVNAGNGRTNQILDYLMDGRAARKSGRETIKTSAQIIKHHVRELKAAGWITQKSGSDQVDVTSNYQELLRQRAEERKQDRKK
jgi:hypothetical protein